MSLKTFLKDIFSVGAGELLSGVKRQVKETMDEAETRLNKMIRNLMRSIVIVAMCLLAGIFALVGLAKYLEQLPNIGDGIGHILVGGVLFLLAIFAMAMQKEK